ncbi:WYL domain-containing protein [Streptomyces sp. 1222.2]|uniref:WYL domain-containing protein n=1 Tax=Streptomyces sp. 1222.2 TaxID=1938833 RepID=UPI001C53BCB0|nr:WYL domain-containing protein [Streptomyces sp. 1222.2]
MGGGSPGRRIPGVHGVTPDGRITVVIRGPSEYGLAGHLAGLGAWLDITSPPGVRDHLAAIGNALTGRYGGSGRRAATRERP